MAGDHTGTKPIKLTEFIYMNSNILDPITGKWHPITSSKGKKVLKIYLKQAGGGWLPGREVHMPVTEMMPPKEGTVTVPGTEVEEGTVTVPGTKVEFRARKVPPRPRDPETIARSWAARTTIG